MTEIGAQHTINDTEYEVVKITDDRLSFGDAKKAWVQLRALDGSGTITFQRMDLETCGAEEAGAFQLPGQSYPQAVDNFSDKIELEGSHNAEDSPTPERLIWTVAHRNPRANRFVRAEGPDAPAFTWAVASAMGNHLAAEHPSEQWWVTTTRAHDDANPSEDSHNIMVDSGRRIAVKPDRTTTTLDHLTSAFSALVALGHKTLDTPEPDSAPVEDSQTAQTPDVSIPVEALLSLHGVEVKITATIDDGSPDGETFDWAVVPSGDPGRVMHFARLALANPLWYNVTIEEIMPLADTCDHPSCNRPAPYTGLRHEANAVRAGSSDPHVAGEILVPPHTRRVNVCGTHAATWGLWGYSDKPLVDSPVLPLADWTIEPVFKFRVGYRVEFGGNPDSPSFATVANVGSRWLYLVDYDGNKLGKILRTDARALNYR